MLQDRLSTMMSIGAAALCDTCKGLQLTRKDFEGESHREEQYGQVVIRDSLENLRETQTWCKLCHLFWQAIIRNERSQPHILEQSQNWSVSWNQSCMEYSPFDDREFDLALYPKLDHPDCHCDCCIQLIDFSNTLDPYRARLIPDKIDPEMLIGWLMRCNEEHGPNCSEASLQLSAHPLLKDIEFLVVDVDQLCLCRMPEGNTYVTLSYVWGKTAMPSTVNANVERRMIPDALSQIDLPQTIRDAIEVVRAMRLRYLWIDTLCIVQDHNSKQSFIDAMDAVYMHACFCIVAATGENANSGLSSWSRDRGREGIFPVSSISDDLRLGVLPFFDGQMMHSLHASRAWTFQEGALSNRCLVFLDSQVYFCCRKAIWREDVHAECSGCIEPGFSANTLARTLDSTILRRYSQCVESYTGRDLTFEADALKAFAGMEKALSRSMNQTRFWSGLPAVAFDWAILWTTARGSPLLRRVQFPSYSWAGWKGHISPATDHYAEFDQQWLRTRTWIDWYIADDDGNFIEVWNPQRDGTTCNLPEAREVKEGRDALSASGMKEIKSCTSYLMHDRISTQSSDVETKEDIHDVSDDINRCTDSNEGEGDSSSDDSQEFCPHYAEPSSGGPYGRELVNNLNVPIPGIKGSLVHQSTNHCFKPGTLRFETYVATYTLARTQLDADLGAENRKQQTKSSSFFNLLDNEGRLCGIIWDSKRDVESKRETYQIREQKVDVLILSYAAPGTKQPFTVLNLELTPPYQAVAQGDQADMEEWIADEWHAWDMLNVMLAMPVTNSYSGNSHQAIPVVRERYNVGLLHKNALLRALDPLRWETVYLF